MTTIYNRIQSNFTQVSNLAGLDPNLSAKAFKLYWYMCYRIGTCPTWQFNRNEIIKHFKEGDSAIRVAFNELIDVGFLVRKRTRAEKGKFSKMEYEIYAEPINKDSSPCVENPHVGNQRVAEPRVADQPHNNKEIINKEIINKDSSFGEEKKEENNLNEIEEIIILTKNSKTLPIDKIEFMIKRYFDIKWLNNNVEEFLLYYKENLRETFEKLPYRASIWVRKFENEIKPKRESSNPTQHVSQDKSYGVKLMEAKKEYCLTMRKSWIENNLKIKTPSELTEEEINKIKEELNETGKND